MSLVYACVIDDSFRLIDLIHESVFDSMILQAQGCIATAYLSGQW